MTTKEIKRKIRVAVVEDDKPFRNYLESEIWKMPSCSFDYGVGSFEAIKQDNIIEDYNPDVILLDMKLGDDWNGGLKIVGFFQKRKNKIPKILIVSTHCADYMIGLMQQTKGVNGCIQKSLLTTYEFTFLESLIKKAYQSNEFISTTQERKQKPYELTDIQQDILLRLAQGQSQKEIAESRGVKESGIGQTISNLRDKFDVKTTVQLLMEAKELGYLN